MLIWAKDLTWSAETSFEESWQNTAAPKNSSPSIKIKVYHAVVLTTLLYGCKTWTTYQQHIKKLNHFHTTCLRKTLGITWQKRISDTEILTRDSLPSIYTILRRSPLRWAGHVVCVKDLRLPKKLLYGEVSQGKCSQGCQKKRFKDTLNVSLKSFDITPNCLEYLVQDRDKWRQVAKLGAKVCETNNWGTAISSTVTAIPCSHCPRLFHAQISLISHLWTQGCLPQS